MMYIRSKDVGLTLEVEITAMKGVNEQRRGR